MFTNKTGGFVSLLLLLTLPLIVSLIFLFAYASLKTLEIEKSLHHCRQVVLNQQIQFLSDIQRLTSMNRLASMLRQERRIAERAVKMAVKSGNPYALAAALAALKIVIAKQKVFHLKQQAIIHLSQAKAMAIKFKAAASIEDMAFSFNKVETFGHWRMALRQTPRLSASPSYVAKYKFSKSQVIGLRWQVKSPLPFDTKNLPVPLSCAASIYKKGASHWQVKLTPTKVDKWSSKFSSAGL